MSETSPLAGMVRRHDPDRFLTALFAPSERRETLFALYAFNHEIARAWEVASHPTLALIRLQWWREVIEGAARRHEVATPLMAEVASGRLDSTDLLTLIEGRELVEAGFTSPGDWRTYLDATAGALAAIAGKALGARDGMSRLRALGTAYGVAGQLRSRASWAEPAPPADLAAWAAGLLGKPARIDRAVVAAGLVGVLARRDLRHPGAIRVRGLGDRAAVVAAAVLARV